MAIQKNLSCFVIGSDGLLIECADILLRQGHAIRGVISDTPRIVRWARERGLETIDPTKGYVEALARQPFDYLFSITYLEVIPDEALTLPVQGAINFHDGPLPRYAGLNAPAWALLHRETSYGISWHRIGSKVDAGDVLKQVTFDLAVDETSLSLNTKCFAHAIETFAELVTELSSDTVVATAQDLSGRSYFGRHQRPAASCAIDWTRPAAEIEALVRALDFGERYANPLGVAKVQAGTESFVVTRAEARSDDASRAPGTVTFVGGDAIGVATGEGVLSILGAATLAGEPLALEEVARRLGLEEGSQFENIAPSDLERWTSIDKALVRAERFWIERLRKDEPIEAPFARSSDGILRRHADVPLRLPSPPEALASELVAAFAIYCARIAHKDTFSMGLAQSRPSLAEAPRWWADVVPLSMTIDWNQNFAWHCDRARQELEQSSKKETFLRDVVGRYPELRSRPDLADGTAWPACVVLDAELPHSHAVALVVPRTGEPRISYDAEVIPGERAEDIARQLANLIEAARREPARNVGTLSLLSDDQRKALLEGYNDTARGRRDATVHRLVEEQVARTPSAGALAFEDRTLSYRELNQRANKLARHLRSLGVGPDSLVGIHVFRSVELVVSALATLKAGGAYVPLDPAYPPDRIAFMVADSKLHVVISDAPEGESPFESGIAVVRVSADEKMSDGSTDGNLEGGAEPGHLAYVIYTSGSTGTPKGVMVEHRNVVNFFAGMDERIPHEPPGTWLAVTSLSFDISVLELLWPLTHGFRVVLHRDRDKDALVRDASAGVSASGPAFSGPMDFSLFYFSSDESGDGGDKYELLLEGAKFADQHGFVAVWTPERHFHAFGGLYPNPAVTGAAVAVLTKNVQIRAGSVVLPLHHPARVAEAWSIVDNLSHGRVGISFASGWQPNDFVLRPENFQDNKKIMFRDLEVVKALWRGEAASFPGPKGDLVSVRTLPRPVQAELPIWITTAGNIDTYKAAGRIGANILTHLLGQSIVDLEPKIRAYRDALAEHGHDRNAGVVSLMLHTYVGEDDREVREAVREPLKRYLASSLELLKHYAWAFPAFSRPKDMSADKGDDLANLSNEERDALLEHAYERYYETSGLFGRPEECLRMVGELARIGVNEVACLIDFGIATPKVLDHLTHLDRLRSLVGAAKDQPKVVERRDHSIAALIPRHRVTHLQCTPSMARMLLDDPEARAALSHVQCWLIGGEAFTTELARDALGATQAMLFNMYGPTETTVWSTVERVTSGATRIPIGTPIANTRVYVLDPRGEPMPPEAIGELFIAGDGVARGYLHRDDLTRERFVPEPFAAGRMYRTGDLVRRCVDGSIEFVGRRDQQVKIRGHRVELGEIEAAIAKQDGVTECAVVLREDAPGDQRIVAYVVGVEPGREAALRDALRERLPEFMVPAHVVSLAELPQTPNRKIDRKALPPPSGREVVAAAPFTEPATDIERTIAKLWQELLGRDRIGLDDNFFDVGGHSLLVVRMHRQLRELVAEPISLTDLYRFPTIRSLTEFLSRGTGAPASSEAMDRADKRREMALGRRRSSHV